MSINGRRKSILFGLLLTEGLCDEAWKPIYQYVFALADGSNGWYFDDWFDLNKHPGVAIVSCNDGRGPQ